MKKTKLLLLLTISLLFAFAVTAVAGYTPLTDDTVADDEFTIVTFNSTKSFTKTDDDISQMEYSINWMVANKDKLNLAFVSLLGDLTNSSSKTDYNKVVTVGGGTMAQFVQLCLSEEDWQAEFGRLLGSTMPLTEAKIPFSAAIGFMDYPGATGKDRTNMLGAYFTAGTMYPEENPSAFFNESNSYYCFTYDSTAYMVMTLELWPRKAVLDWANDVMSSNADKRVILITPSFLHTKGEMHKMWDWQIMIDNKLSAAQFWTEEYMKAPYVTTDITSGNITWTDNPRDGDGLWSYSLKKHDNLFLIINSKLDNQDSAGYKGEIVKNTFKNDAGYDVAAVLANIEPLVKENAAIPLVIKIGDRGRKVDVAYCSPDDGMWDFSAASFTLNLKEVKESSGIVRPVMKKQALGTNTAYIKGYEENTFRPQNNMTRAEACTIIARLLSPQEEFKGQYKSSFADVAEGDWYYDYVAYLETMEFLERYSGSFFPNQNITRAEFSELVTLAGGLSDGTKSVYFRDVNADHPFYGAIMAAAKTGLVNGYEDETFRPDNTITRAEVVTIINRCIGTVGSADVIEGTNVNVFSDISGHWAYYNIISASNSNIKSSKYANLDMTGITQSENTINIENSLLRISISKLGARVTSVYDKVGGKELINNAASPQFAYLISASGAKLVPNTAELLDNRLCLSFNDGAKVFFIVEAKDDYITFEVDSFAYATYHALYFLNTQLKFSQTSDEDFMVVGLSMSSKIDPVYFPNPQSMALAAKTYTQTGINGAKYAVIGAPKKNHLEIMKKVTLAMEKDEAPVSIGVGGAFAMESSLTHGDYVIISDSTKENIDAWTPMYVEYGVDQLDFHKGGSTFRQGDFFFHKYASAADFKQQIADPLRAKGILSGLHTYSFYIDPGASPLLSDPKWQRDLLISERYTLAQDIGKFASTFPTVESTKGADRVTGFRATSTQYFLVDQEIIKIDVTAIGDNQFASVQRAQCGTASQAHEAGTQMKRIAGYYSGITPIPGSPLFYEVARLTAIAYNEGGFGMIYFDALDGISRHATSELSNIYATQFVNAVLKDCINPPIVEMSMFPTNLWTARGRANAWDYPTRAYKTWNVLHKNNNENYAKSYMPSILGWYNPYPVVDFKKYPANWQVHYQFFDDIDHMGTLAVAYDYGMVYNNLSLSTFASYPAYKRNMDQYKIYSKLRKTKYFSDAVKAKLKTLQYEAAIVEKSAGVYAFFEKYYAVGRIANAKDSAMAQMTGKNPFAAQQPFVRIEADYSSKGENPIVILKLDESKDLIGQTLKANYTSFLDATDHYALKVKVLGNNSSDAICIRIKGYVTEDSNVSEYVVKLDYEGWREFTFVKTSNGDYEDIAFTGRTIATYELYRGTTNFNQIQEVSILTYGNCKGVKVSNVTLVNHIANDVTNPTLTIGNQSITYNCTLKSGEYIEHFPGETTALIYDAVGNSRPVDSITGSLTIASGSFKAVYSAQTAENVPTLARVTFGFTGPEITG